MSAIFYTYVYNVIIIEPKVVCNTCFREVGKYHQLMKTVTLNKYVVLYTSLTGMVRECSGDAGEPHRHTYDWILEESFSGFYRGLISIKSLNRNRDQINVCRPDTPFYSGLPLERLFHEPRLPDGITEFPTLNRNVDIIPRYVRRSARLNASIASTSTANENATIVCTTHVHMSTEDATTEFNENTPVATEAETEICAIDSNASTEIITTVNTENTPAISETEIQDCASDASEGATALQSFINAFVSSDDDEMDLRLIDIDQLIQEENLADYNPDFS